MWGPGYPAASQRQHDVSVLYSPIQYFVGMIHPAQFKILPALQPSRSADFCFCHGARQVVGQVAGGRLQGRPEAGRQGAGGVGGVANCVQEECLLEAHAGSLALTASSCSS